MERFINVYDFKLKGIPIFDENLDVLIPLSAVRKALQMTPTADVVPKSEVAREIFEEIDKFTYRYLNDADYSGGDMIYDLNELKKKCTEDKT